MTILTGLNHLDDYCRVFHRGNYTFSRLVSRKVTILHLLVLSIRTLLQSRLLCEQSFTSSLIISMGLTLAVRSEMLKDKSIVKQVQSKLASWKAQCLSRARHEVLVKSVGMAMPFYSLLSILVPKTICSKLDAVIRAFWWAKEDVKKGLYLKEKSLWGDLIRDKYLKGDSFMHVSLKNFDSWVWKAILWSRKLLVLGTCHRAVRIGAIDVWEDPWIPNLTGFRP
ncbi:hypothetical protein TorRG33x02_168650 [Trema orientale]|uniref:Reverse transcriptase zinc-binding domain-containing protein n=1 Tax=Trema orientale TaxID=63057 RepID=A0A2P5EPA2_TREOI|nr:hypothetical protein TorRG33x02_168650 [Trema orientale]